MLNPNISILDPLYHSSITLENFFKILFGHVELLSSFDLIFGLLVILLGPPFFSTKWCFADIGAFLATGPNS